MANRYWVGGTNNWNATAGTKWATTSGGAGGSAVPTAADDVFFDGASGAVTVTIASTGARCRHLDFTGFTGTFAGSQSNNISGSLTLGSGMTWTNSGSWLFNATSSQTITSNGIAIRNNVEFNGSGGSWVLQDDFNPNSIGGRTFQVTQGTLNLNNQNITTGGLTFTGTLTRAITMGSGTWTIVSPNSTTFWNVSGTGLTFTANTSTIKYIDTGANNITFSGGGLTYNNLWFSRGSNTNSITIAGSNTFNDFKDDGTGAHSLIFTAGTTQTFTTFTVSGTAGNLITINSTTTGTHTLSQASGTVNSSYLDIQHSVAQGGATWNASNSVDNQAVATAGSGWNFISSTAIKTFLGNTYANTKTVDDLAIASVKTWEGLA